MHVVDGHSIVALGKAGKGAFTVGTDVTALVKAAEAVQPVAQSGQFAGRLERVVDAGHVIGVTREGVATSFYKVITDGANNLVTAFPVKP
jgi:hypothetical protein